MTDLRTRKTKLVFTTSDEQRDRGKYRRIVVHAEPESLTLRLHGTRRRFVISYRTILEYAQKLEADRLRRIKAEERKAKKSGGRK